MRYIVNTDMLKKIIAVIVILVTFAVFGYYIYQNPEMLDTLTTLSPVTIIGLTIGYVLMIIINSLILHWSLHFVGYRIKLLENILLTGYSTIVNFFGPLQSGPGVRAVYLKKKHKVRIRDFSVTLLVFYAFFALINGLILLIAFLLKFSSPQAYLAIAVVTALTGIGIWLAIKKSSKLREAITKIKLTDRNLWLVSLGALLSIIFTAFIYYLELNHVSNIDIWQTLIYTAAANFALFVSLTPGAIGFRESFILLSQQLHGIDTATIIGANIIDRAFYVIFLLVLFAILLLVNARKRLPVFDKPSK